MRHARRERPLGALRIGDENLTLDARQKAETGDDLLHVGHLRDRLWAHEGAELKPLEASRHQTADQLDLGLGRHKDRNVLQPVAGADLNYGDLAQDVSPALAHALPEVYTRIDPPAIVRSRPSRGGYATSHAFRELDALAQLECAIVGDDGTTRNRSLVVIPGATRTLTGCRRAQAGEK